MILFVVLLAVVAPRFDQNDLGPLDSITGTTEDGNLGDAANYTRYVEVIRGDADDLPPAPFRYRPLTPLLAAPLPFDALTAINVVNVFALAVATAGLWWILSSIGANERWRIIGCLLFIVSFPTFYYGAIGYVDPLAIAFVMLGTGAALTDRRLVLLALLPLAALARESTVIVIPVAIVWLIACRHDRRTIVRWSLAWFALFGVTILVMRVGLQAAGTNVWEPSVDVAISNLSRPRTWISALLTLGVPAAILAVKHRSIRSMPHELQLVFGAGMLLSVGVFAYAIVGAYADGRFLWPIYVYTVPAAVYLLARPTIAETSATAVRSG